MNETVEHDFSPPVAAAKAKRRAGWNGIDLGRFFAELKRRHVYRAAIAYGVVAWLVVQIATQVFPFFEIPNWVVRLVVLVTILGFPAVLIIAWAFEMTPEGLKRNDEIQPNERIPCGADASLRRSSQRWQSSLPVYHWFTLSEPNQHFCRDLALPRHFLKNQSPSCRS